MNAKNIHSKIFNPRGLTCFLAMPINLIVPLIITSLIWGIPYPLIVVNKDLEKFESVFERIELPSEVDQQGNVIGTTTQLSSTYTKVGNLIDNVAKEKLRLEELNKIKTQDPEQIPSGTFSSSNEEPEEKKEIKNTCDMFAGKIIVSKIAQENLSKQLLNNFSLAIEGSIEANYYTYVVSSQLRLIPINAESLKLHIENFDLDILKDFKLKSNDFNFEENSYYLVYMINDNVYDKNDPRCKN